jgi:hypothetical protein
MIIRMCAISAALKQLPLKTIRAAVAAAAAAAAVTNQ